MKSSGAQCISFFLLLALFPLVSFAIGIYNPSGVLLNAEQIYWPATSTGATMNGPYSTTTNPNGHGDAVLPTYIDFDPWVSTVSGNITTNTTWNASSTYVIDGTLTVDAGKTLTIASGTVVKFKTATSNIINNGTIIADGLASTSRIYFTSYKDDTVGGDTNGDGAATSPAAGDWNTIKTNSNASSTFKFAIVRYGGYTGTGGSTVTLWNNGGELTLYESTVAVGTTYGIYTDGTVGYATTTLLATTAYNFATSAAYTVGGTFMTYGSQLSISAYGLVVTGGKAVIDSSEISGNTEAGIYQSGGIVDVKASEIYNNHYGIYMDGGEDLYVHSNYFHNNTLKGLYNNKTSYDLDAQYNYWDASDGPGGDGTGSGDEISSPAFNADILYVPYLTSEHYILVDDTGNLLSAVHTGTITYEAATTTYTSALWGAIGTWNALGTITIATSTSSSTDDLLVFDIDDTSASFVAAYQPQSANDTLRFNTPLMPTESNGKLWVASHELGHALGLQHSYIDNLMYCCYQSAYATTTPGIQDRSDYDYLW